MILEKETRMTLDELRSQLIGEYPSVRSDQREAGQRLETDLKLESARQLERQGLIFSVSYQGTDYFPLFQFCQDTGKPMEIIKELIEIFELGKSNSWELFIWLVCPTGLLGGIKPVELMQSEPERVLKAARCERADPYF